MVQGQIGLVDRRQLEVVADEVDVLDRRARRGRDRLGVLVRVEFQRIGVSEAVEAVDVGVETGRRIAVAQPHLRGITLEQTHATAQLGRALAVEGVVETEARLDQELVAQHIAVVATEER
ncbi:hypothetical protein D3C72_1919130 [compost metagenome]